MHIKSRVKNTLLLIKEDGLVSTFISKARSLLNWGYRYLVWHNPFMKFDFTASVLGIKHIKVNNSVRAGRHFWLQAVNEYKGQIFHPKIVFKGNFSASDFCHIGATHYVEIGKNVLFGSKVYVTDHGHGIYSGSVIQSHPEESPLERKLDSDKEVIIGDNVWVGDNVTILPNVHIGNGCVIGSNSVVTKDIPDNCIAVGIPAKVIKKYDFERKKWVVV